MQIVLMLSKELFPVFKSSVPLAARKSIHLAYLSNLCIGIQASCVLTDSNCKEQDIVLSAGGATRVARATISNQISLVQDAVGPVGPSTIV